MKALPPAFAALALAVLASAAAASGQVSLSSSMMKEIVATKPDGSREVRYVDPTSATPGDTIVIEIAYHNEGPRPAGDVVISNPVPAHLKFIEIVKGDGAAVSVDGGKTFGQLMDLRVTTPTPRRAQPADVTHVR